MVDVGRKWGKSPCGRDSRPTLSLRPQLPPNSRRGSLSSPSTLFSRLGRNERAREKSLRKRPRNIFSPFTFVLYTDDISLSVSAATPPQNPAPPPPWAQKLDGLGGLFFIPWPVPLFLRPPFRYCLAAAAASVQSLALIISPVGKQEGGGGGSLLPGGDDAETQPTKVGGAAQICAISRSL